jgi:uncharacterized protein YidB (DUF937 family)
MANKGMPSLLALLGLVAVAGYQNRDKLRDMIADARGGAAPAGGAPMPEGVPSGGLLDEIGTIFGGSKDSGRNLKEGLDSLLERFRSAGQGDKADSWVSTGANTAVQSHELESAIGGDIIDELSRKTGLSRDELLKRLSVALPDTVNRLTPGGRVPSEGEAQSLL